MSSTDFWTRRRAAVAAEDAALARETVEAETARREAEWDDAPDEAILAEAGLPLPEDLTSPEDVRAFLGSAVPNRLKTRALRRLWTLNPALANLDGLVDYGEDFTDSALAVENLQTAYQVGKGMLKHVQELAAPKERADPEVAEPEVAAPEPTVAVLAPEDADPAPRAAIEPTEKQTMDDDPLPAAPTGRRRMMFTFSDPPV